MPIILTVLHIQLKKKISGGLYHRHTPASFSKVRMPWNITVHILHCFTTFLEGYRRRFLLKVCKVNICNISLCQVAGQTLKAYRWRHMPIRNGTDLIKYFQRTTPKWKVASSYIKKLPWLGNEPRNLCFYNTCADASDKYLCSNFLSCLKYLSACLRVLTDYR